MTIKTAKFLRTLHTILHTESPTILAWSPCGTFFQVYDITRLEQDVLPRYFKHGKFASFQRQLNNFGFRKWTKTRASVCTFSHDTLTRCQPSELPALMIRSSVTLEVQETSSHKRPRVDEVEVSDQLRVNKKAKAEVVSADDERESSTDVSDLLALDWSILSESSQFDDLADDDCVGLPIELFFPAAKQIEMLEPLSLGESTLVGANEWQILVECLA